MNKKSNRIILEQLLEVKNKEEISEGKAWGLYYITFRSSNVIKGFPGGAMVKNLPANEEDIRDVGSIPGSGRAPGGGATHSSILAWRLPKTEEPGGLQSLGLQRVRHD